MSKDRDIAPGLWTAQPIKVLSKKEIRSLIKIAKSLQVFVHPGYYSWDDNRLPRVETTKAWMTEFVAEVPTEDLPGVQILEFQGELLARFWPPGTWNVIAG